MSEAGAENCRAEAHKSGARRDRGFEIGGHAHAEHRQVMRTRKACQLVEVRLRVPFLRRDAHETDDIELERARQLQKRTEFGWPHSGFLRLGAQIDLDQKLWRARFFFNRSGKRVGELGPIERLDHVEKAHSIASLIGLKRPDEVQFRSGKLGLKSRPFDHRLLNAILAKDTLSGREHRADRGGIKGLGDRHESHLALGTASGFLARADFPKHALITCGGGDWVW